MDRPGLDASIRDVAAPGVGPVALCKSLVTITQVASTTVAGVDFASVTIRHPSGRLETVAPSSPLMYVADGLQYELNEGPSYDAVTDAAIVYCADLDHDSRWPDFGPRAKRLGLSSLLVVRLVHPGDRCLALNLYSDAVGAFNDHHRVARIFLNEAFLKADPEQQGQTLHAALTSRTMVQQATGILMQRHGVDAEQALELLNQLAKQRGRDRYSEQD